MPVWRRRTFPRNPMFRRGLGRVENRSVHEAFRVTGRLGTLHYPLLHHSYPTLSDYIEHMNRYSSLGAEMVVAKNNGKVAVLSDAEQAEAQKRAVDSIQPLLAKDAGLKTFYEKLKSLAASVK